MNPPPNKVAIFGFLQKDVPEAKKLLAKSPPMPPPSQFLASPTAPAIGLNYLDAPLLPGFGDGGSLFRPYHTPLALGTNVYDAPMLPSDVDRTRQSVLSQVGNAEQATVRTRPNRRRRALRGEPSDERDHSDCSTTAVYGSGARRSLRRTSVHFWPYSAAQRQAHHRRRFYNYSAMTTA